METLFDQYKELNINGSLICLEQVEDIYFTSAIRPMQRQ